MLACNGPGTLYTPDGPEMLRTASYRVGLRDGEPEMVLLLSNGHFTCGWPSFSDTETQAMAIAALLAAACREGARHVSLRAWDRTLSWDGVFPGRSNVPSDALSDEIPRLATGSFYAVEEAFLVEIDGLARGYAASEEIYYPHMGDGGTVELSPAGTTRDGTERMRGWFAFPEEGISGEFLAERCVGDTSLLDVVTAQTDHYCL